MSKKPLVDTIPLDNTMLDRSNANQAAGLGELFDRYRIVEEISQGGMGTIYRAHQASLNREVAIKTLRGTGDGIAADRFFREASLAAKLSDPHTVQLYDFGQTENGTLYLVMELISGENLKDWITKHGALEQQELIDVFLQLCGALAEAHEMNLVHRDIKPSNIIINRRKGAGLHAKLIDFGLVKDTSITSELSQTGIVLGSPMYMSPEQVSGHDVDNRSDIYALGMPLYHAATGNRRYDKHDIAYLLNAQLNIMPKPPSELNSEIGETLEWIIFNCITKNADRRFQSVQQLGKSLQLCKSTINDTQPIKLALKDGQLYNANNLSEPISDEKPLDRSFRPNPIELETLANATSPVAIRRKPTVMDFLPWVLVAALTFIIAIALVPDMIFGNKQVTEAHQKRSERSEPMQDEQTARPKPQDAPAANKQVNEKPMTPKNTIGVESNKQATKSIIINSVPTGAELYLNTENVGTTPHEISLEIGSEQRFILKMKQYEDKAILVTSQASDPVYTLSPIKTERSRRKSKRTIKKEIESKPKTTPAHRTEGIRNPW